MAEDIHLNRVDAVARNFNTLSQEMRQRIEGSAIGGVDWYREVLRRLETMHQTLHSKP